MPLLLLYHTGMRLGEVLGLSWPDADFATKRINLSRQVVYINKRGYFFTTLRTELSCSYIIFNDFLLGKLKRWQVQQRENERHFGDSYVCVYREDDGHIERRSKALLVGQTLLMFLFAYFVIFNVPGRDYDAAILSADACGFGMGATPNAMANMQVLTSKFAPSVKAYILVPIVGSMFADFINSLTITFFINFI